VAFGSLLGTLTANGNSIAATNALTGSVAVNRGDLVFAVIGEQTSLTATTATDNLGNTYTAQNAGTLSSTVISGRAYWSRVTNPGTLTSVTISATSSTHDFAAFAVVIQGPFLASPLDTSPANITTDVTSPFSTPATGTLAQANEVVIGWGVANQSTVWAATSPNLLGGNANNSTNAKVAIGYQAVSATTTVTPVFTAAANPTNSVLGTASFKAAPAVPSGYFQQFGKAQVAAVAVPTQATSFAVPGPVGDNTIPAGWHQQTSTIPVQPAVAVPTQATAFAVPPNPSNSITGIGWYQPLSIAAPVAQAKAGSSFVPFNTAQVSTVPPFGWFERLSKAAPVASAPTGQSVGPLTPTCPDAPTSFVITSPVTDNTPTFVIGLPFGHGSPRDAQAGDSLRIQEIGQFTSFYTLTSADIAAHSVTLDYNTFGLSPLPDGSHTINSRIERGTNVSAFSQSATINIIASALCGWRQPLSTAPAVAKAQQGFSTTPFKAQAPIVPPPNGWFGPISPAAKTAVAKPTQATSFAVPPSVAPAANGWFGQAPKAPKTATAQPTQATGFAVPPSAAPPAVTPGQFGWYSPLSTAAPTAKAKPGSTFVPLNTAQVSTVPTTPLVQDRGVTNTSSVYYQSLFNPLPPVTVRSNTVTQLAWQQPLSVAPPVNKAIQTQPSVPFAPVAVPQGWQQPLSTAVSSPKAVNTQPSWVPLASPTVSLGWLQPLSTAATIAQVQSSSFTTVLTPPAQPAPIAGMAWYTQLGTVATSLTTAPQGMSFVPFDTPQVTPPPPPPSTQPENRPFLVTMGRLSCIG